MFPVSSHCPQRQQGRGEHVAGPGGGGSGLTCTAVVRIRVSHQELVTSYVQSLLIGILNSGTDGNANVTTEPQPYNLITY